MRFGSGGAVLAAIYAIAGSPALAAVCLDKSNALDEIVAVINAAPGCGRAMAIFKDCQFGASGDVQLGAAVEKKCEGDFLSRLTAAGRRHISTRWLSATGNTPTSRARCTARSRCSAGQRSPSVTPVKR